MILRNGAKNLGKVGEKTNYRTIHGEDVHIGDLVKVDFFDGMIKVVEPMVKAEKNCGEIKSFVMGIEVACDDNLGTVEGKKILEIVKPYTALKVGEELGECGVTVEEDTEEKEETPSNDDLGRKVFLGIMKRAIDDLKESNKDYHGLEFILTVLVEGGVL